MGPTRGAFDKRRAALRFSQYLRDSKPVSGFSTALRPPRRSVLQKRRLFPPREGPSIRAAVHPLHAGVVVSCGVAYSRSNVPRCVRLCPVCKGSGASFTWCAAISARSLNRPVNQDWGAVMSKEPLRVAHGSACRARAVVSGRVPRNPAQTFWRFSGRQERRRSARGGKRYGVAAAFRPARFGIRSPDGPASFFLFSPLWCFCSAPSFLPGSLVRPRRNFRAASSRLFVFLLLKVFCAEEREEEGNCGRIVSSVYGPLLKKFYLFTFFFLRGVLPLLVHYIPPPRR